MPTPAYMSVKGNSQGDITKEAMSEKSVGTLAQDDHDSESIVYAFRHEIKLPRDPVSGATTGDRVHDAVVITKVFDKSSPMLYKALCTNETLEVTIKWYRPAKKGGTENYFTHKLTDATIVGIKAIMPNCQDPGQAQFTHLEEVSFAYEKIEWNHLPGNTMEMDSWKKKSSGK